MSYLEDSLDMVAGLQEEVYLRVVQIQAAKEGRAQVSHDDIVEYYHYLYALMEKQQILLTRIQLMKDETIEGIITGIQMLADSFGRDPEQDRQSWHTMMKSDTILMLEELTGELIDPSNLELDIHWEE